MSIKLDQALVQSFIDGAFGLPVAHENDDYSPVAGTAYAELDVTMNGENGFTLTDLNDITGYLQIGLNYPTGAGAIPAKTMEKTVADAYPIGTVLTYSAQSLEITGIQRPTPAPRDGWYRRLLRINFVAYLPR